ncbi:receptor-type tyrosine-protein phosphatase U [Sarotherodon galilaeus]
MVEEENYVTVIFQTKGDPTYVTPKDAETIYDEVNTEERKWDAPLVITENKEEAPARTRLVLVVTGLVIICLILVSVIIALIFHFNTVMREQKREMSNITAQNLQLMKQKTSSERRTEELTRERDQLNWTIGVIMEYQEFSVEKHCPQKVCKPCLDDWVLFQSSCYLFFRHRYLSYWRTWDESRDYCKVYQAALAVIESQEEQEFINNHTKDYHADDRHGYWIGLRAESPKDTWTWVDGSNLTVTYWKTQQAVNRFCTLSLPKAPPLANWGKESCDMKNCWICERRALIKGH